MKTEIKRLINILDDLTQEIKDIKKENSRKYAEIRKSNRKIQGLEARHFELNLKRMKKQLKRIVKM